MKYYIYLYLRESGTPYYVGKGSDKRAYQNGGRNCYKPPKDRIKIIFTSDDEDTVLELERTLIKFYGRKCDGGILQNLSEGGQNPPNMKGVKWTEDRKQRASVAAKKDNRIQYTRNGKGGAKIGNRNSMGHAKEIVLDGVTFESISAAARATGTSRQNIQNWLKGTKRMIHT